MKFEKNSLGSEASSYSSRKVSSSSYADAKPRRRRERTKEEENMVVGWESLASFSGPLGRALVWAGGCLKLWGWNCRMRVVQPCMQGSAIHHLVQFSSTLGVTWHSTSLYWGNTLLLTQGNNHGL